MHEERMLRLAPPPKAISALRAIEVEKQARRAGSGDYWIRGEPTETEDTPRNAQQFTLGVESTSFQRCQAAFT